MLVEINLLTEKEKKDVTNWFIAAIILFLLLSTFTFFKLYSSQLQEEINQVTQESITVQEQIALKQQVVEVRPVSQSEKLVATIGELESLVIPSSELLRELVRVLPEHGYFVSFTFQEPDQVILTAYFHQIGSIAAYNYELTNSPYLASAMLSNITTESILEEDVGTGGVLPRYVAYFTLTVDRSAFFEKEDE